MFLGVVYWAVWRIVLPHIFGYKLVPGKDTLSDGTVVTVVSLPRIRRASNSLIPIHQFMRKKTE